MDDPADNDPFELPPTFNVRPSALPIPLTEEEEAERNSDRRRLGRRSQSMKFTPENRRMVTALAYYGIYHEHICRHIKNPQTGEPITEPELRKNFAKELLEGANAGVRQIAKSLYMHMEGRPAEYLMDKEGQVVMDSHGRPIVLRAEVKPNVAAPIFLAKVRRDIGFRESIVVEHTRGVDSELSTALEPLSLDEKRQLRKLLDAREEAMRLKRQAATAIENGSTE